MHVCFFDIDGTLIDTGGAGLAAMRTTVSAEFQVAEDAGNVPFAGRTDRAIVRDIFRYHSIDDTPENWERFFSRFTELLAKHLPLRNGRVLPGVEQLLTSLQDRHDVTLGLLTGNLRVGARLKLVHYGLYDFFHQDGEFATGGYGDVRLERDHVAGDALRAAQSALSKPIDPKRTWVIGDTPNDVQCARAIGANAVAVATGQHSETDLAATEPDLLLPNLLQPTELLAHFN